jgi:hypothetical protein
MRNLEADKTTRQGRKVNRRPKPWIRKEFRIVPVEASERLRDRPAGFGEESDEEA